jgi:hypothetical protein
MQPKTVTAMDTFKDELLKGFASKAINKALSSSQMQNHQFNFQRFDSNGGPYFYPSQLGFEPSHIIPRPRYIWFRNIRLQKMHIYKTHHCIF